MAARPPPRSREGVYVSPSPPSNVHDPFNHRYDDNDPEHAYGRRDTYGSDSSAAYNEGERGYYDHGDVYGMF